MIDGKGLRTHPTSVHNIHPGLRILSLRFSVCTRFFSLFIVSSEVVTVYDTLFDRLLFSKVLGLLPLQWEPTLPCPSEGFSISWTECRPYFLFPNWPRAPCTTCFVLFQTISCPVFLYSLSLQLSLPLLSSSLVIELLYTDTTVGQIPLRHLRQLVPRFKFHKPPLIPTQTGNRVPRPRPP